VSERPTSAPTPGALFVTFFSIARSGFGGALPFARRTLVERHGWLTAGDFTETLSLCQTLPGPNVVNLSIVVGARASGWRGSLAAFAGLVGTPVIVVIALGALYGRFGGLGSVRHALARVADGGWKLAIVTAATAAAAYFARINPLWRLLAAGALGVLG
jgi:chromate transporter